MIELIQDRRYYENGELLSEKEVRAKNLPYNFENGYKKTLSYSVLSKHNQKGEYSKGDVLKLKFDCLASHDITYVGIIETARASGLKAFPVPYVLTNCHNSLCSVGGTINEDDHVYGLSAAKKYGGIYVPKHVAVIHSFMRERFAGGEKMILGSDSHTRYGAIGTMAIGEGGGELVKQLLGFTYDVKAPEIVGVRLFNKVRLGVGPMDVALAIVGAVFKIGFVKNRVMEFFGEGIKNLPQEFRNGIDVMTTETSCLSSIWETDETTEDYLIKLGRAEEYKKLSVSDGACYDAVINVDLSLIEPMIALPFHPANAYKLQDLLDNPYEILSECQKEGRKLIGNDSFDLLSKIVNGKIRVDQGVIAGCSGGTYDNVYAAAQIMKKGRIGNDAFSMSVYPGSLPIYLELARTGVLLDLTEMGAIVKTCFCGPCFGAGDVPSNNAFSIRHTTRNFENREGSKPQEKQIASVALMDSRSIASTAMNGGILTSALGIDYEEKEAEEYNAEIYKKIVYNGYKHADDGKDVIYGPNIAPWPKIPELKDNLIVEVASAIYDPVTTTDELIPSGETSSYRSNPLRLAEFALSRKDPDYVSRTKLIARKTIKDYPFIEVNGEYNLSSAIFAIKPGDGSAREQAVSCQRVLGGGCNFAREYATKRYRSNLINWGVIPFETAFDFRVGDVVLVKNVKSFILSKELNIPATVYRANEQFEIVLSVSPLTDTEREIINRGCLINYYNSL